MSNQDLGAVKANDSLGDMKLEIATFAFGSQTEQNTNLEKVFLHRVSARVVIFDFQNSFLLNCESGNSNLCLWKPNRAKYKLGKYFLHRVSARVVRRIPLNGKWILL